MKIGSFHWPQYVLGFAEFLNLYYFDIEGSWVGNASALMSTREVIYTRHRRENFQEEGRTKRNWHHILPPSMHLMIQCELYHCQ